MRVLISVFAVSVKRQVEPERGAEFPPCVRRSAAGGSDGGHFLTAFADFVAVASVISATSPSMCPTWTSSDRALTDRRAQGGGHCARAIEDGVSEGWFVNNVWPRWSARDAPGLSASTIAGLKEVWTDEHERWQKRDLSMKRYVYFLGRRHPPESAPRGSSAVHS